MRDRSEILAKCYSKSVVTNKGTQFEKILQHSQFLPHLGAEAQLEVLLDIRSLLEKTQ